jgi:WhiB family redox-sensing transcriptional regulator
VTGAKRYRTYATIGDWGLRAACKDSTRTMEMPSLATERLPEGRRQVMLAKAICWRCPVLEQCRQWALTEPDPVPGMIAGDMTPDERKTARRA